MGTFYRIKCHCKIKNAPKRQLNCGFTIIELVISIGIYIFLLTAVLASYRTFNTNALFLNASEDIVLALRQAQVYGVGTKANTVTCGFSCAYGVHIDTTTPNMLLLFVDANNDKVYTSGSDTIVQTRTWVNSIAITEIVCGTISCGAKMNITFTRPTPDAFITNFVGLTNRVDNGRIVLTDLKTGRRATVILSGAGQISLQ